jgi:hypothetical protein
MHDGSPGYSDREGSGRAVDGYRRMAFGSWKTPVTSKKRYILHDLKAVQIKYVFRLNRWCM